jgi:hypothetical protein
VAYLPELHYCCVCGADLGPDNGDGICCGCDCLEEAVRRIWYEDCSYIDVPAEVAWEYECVPGWVCTETLTPE